MKKLYFLVLAFCCTAHLSAQAPSYTDFEWDIINLGFAFSSGEGSQSGSFSGTEVRYNASDRFAIGFGFGSSDIYEDLETIDFTSGHSYLTGEYYFHGDSGQRPFVGVGVGMNFLSTKIPGSDRGDEETSTSSMFAPRIGYEFNHVRITGQMNIVPKESHNNSFSLSIGITLWGGYQGKEYN